MAYTTASKVEAELRATTAFSASTTPSLAQATEWIEETTDYIDALAGQSFESTSYTEYHDYNPSDRNIYLRKGPVISISSVSYNVSAIGVAPSYVEKTADEDYITYIEDDEEGRVEINYNKWQPDPSHPKAIKVVYTAGYSSVPGRITMLATKMVAKRVLDTLLANNFNERNSGGSISVGSINIVEPNDYGLGSYSKLGADISDLKNQLLYQDFRVYRY